MTPPSLDANRPVLKGAPLSRAKAPASYLLTAVESAKQLSA